MRARTIRLWQRIHKWSSLICTLFLLMLCITGLPLIFRDEIDAILIDDNVRPAASAADAASASLDEIVAIARRRYPDEYVRVLSWDDERPNVIKLSIVPTRDAPSSLVHRMAFDARTAEILGEPQPRRGLTSFLIGLHRDFLVGLPGQLFLGAMGLVFVAAIISGVLIYGPFMRRLEFGEIRVRSPTLKMLDLHNLVGIVTAVWALAVAITGALNTVALPLFASWRTETLAALLAPHAGKPPLVKLSSVHEAVTLAQATLPGRAVESVIFPNNRFGSPRHYLIWTKGTTPLTARLFTPVLVDAESGTLTLAPDIPGYLRALQISRPLHFGDYGGWPLKVLWALLDIVTIVVLLSGLYLWLKRMRASSARIRRASNTASTI